jgi:hypothetical protein
VEALGCHLIATGAANMATGPPVSPWGYIWPGVFSILCFNSNPKISANSNKFRKSKLSQKNINKILKFL